MPIYDYKCKKCGHHTEIIHKSDDTSERRCGICDELMDKVIGNVAVIFKGSGFYVNDYTHGQGGAKTTQDAKGANVPVDTKAEFSAPETVAPKTESVKSEQVTPKVESSSGASKVA